MIYNCLYSFTWLHFFNITFDSLPCPEAPCLSAPTSGSLHGHLATTCLEQISSYPVRQWFKFMFSIWIALEQFIEKSIFSALLYELVSFIRSKASHNLFKCCVCPILLFSFRARIKCILHLLTVSSRSPTLSFIFSIFLSLHAVHTVSSDISSFFTL